MNKTQAKKNLRRILESQSFADFYADEGALGIAIMCDYPRGSKENEENEKKVDAFLDNMINEILEESID